MYFVIRRTKFGFRCAAIGGNPTAARIARLPVRSYKTICFIISGLFAVIGGLIDFSYVGTTQPTSGQQLPFEVFRPSSSEAPAFPGAGAPRRHDPRSALHRPRQQRALADRLLHVPCSRSSRGHDHHRCGDRRLGRPGRRPTVDRGALWVTDRTSLEAGPVQCQLDGADVRHLTMHGRRALTRLYIAVRDEAWNTIPFECSKPELELGGGSSPCQVDVPCRRGADPRRVDRHDRGLERGQFPLHDRGQMLASFRYAKLGLNLHHPLPETSAATRRRRGGEPVVGVIPTLIDPQLFVDGRLTAMFAPHEARARVAGERDGRLQLRGRRVRNAGPPQLDRLQHQVVRDPLAVPLPLDAQPGDRIFQSVEVDLSNLLDGSGGGVAGTGSPAGVLRAGGTGSPETSCRSSAHGSSSCRGSVPSFPTSSSTSRSRRRRSCGAPASTSCVSTST